MTSTTHKTLRGPRGGIIVAQDASDELVKKLQSIVFPGIQGGPLMHVIAAKAVAFKEALEPAFAVYQQQVVKNAQALATASEELSSVSAQMSGPVSARGLALWPAMRVVARASADAAAGDDFGFVEVAHVAGEVGFEVIGGVVDPAGEVGVDVAHGPRGRRR